MVARRPHRHCIRRRRLGIGCARTWPLYCRAANEPGHPVETELFMVTLRDTPQPDAEIDETAWIDPAAPPDIELAPLAEQTVLGLLRG
jgi:hypothetical protein